MCPRATTKSYHGTLPRLDTSTYIHGGACGRPLTESRHGLVVSGGVQSAVSCHDVGQHAWMHDLRDVHVSSHSVLVLGRVVLRRHHQATALPGAAVHSLNDVDHLLLIRDGQVILLLLPVPKSIMMCLLRKKNMTVHGS